MRMDRFVLLYDADCGFCRWSLDKILRRDPDGAIRPVPLQSSEADELLRDMDTETKMASWHLVAPDGRVFSAGDAVPELARRLRGGRPIASVAAMFPKSTDRLYRIVARNRERLGRALGAQACAVDPQRR